MRAISEENLRNICKYRAFRFLRDSHAQGEFYCSCSLYRPGSEPKCEFQCSAAEAFTLEDMQNNYDEGAAHEAAKHDREKGEWIDGTQGYFCSKCDFYDQYFFEHSFCPNCGADMRGDTGGDEE